MMDIRLLIGGKSVAASSGATFTRRNPLSEQVVARTAAATVDNARAAVEAATLAFKTWLQTGPGERRALLLEAAAALEARTPRFIETMAAETGDSAAWGRLQRALGRRHPHRGGGDDHADNRRGHPV